MGNEDGIPTVTSVLIRKGDSNDFDQILEHLVKFYTEYHILTVHLGVKDEEVRGVLKERLAKFLKDGVCAVAEIDGNVEGVFIGRMMYRHEKSEPDYLHLPERSQVIERICEKLKENFWNRIPPKFNTACIIEYGIVTPKAQGKGIGDALLTEASKMCFEKGVHVAVSESLTEGTAKYMVKHGFVAVNELPLDQMKDKNGNEFFSNCHVKKSSLLTAFFDETTAFFKSKL